MPQALWIHCHTPSPLGTLTLARTDAGLCGVWFQDQQHAPRAELFAPDNEQPGDALLREAAAQIAAYFGRQLHHFDLPLDLSAGTHFQQAVWHQLQGLAHGELGSYGAIAQAIDRARAVRAVGAAIGRNPLSLIVPCHRVLGSSGALTGYAGGLWRKQALLQLEGHPLFR